MGKKFRKGFLLMLLSCILFGNISIYAAEENFLEVPQERFDVILEDNDLISIASNPALSACEIEVGIASNGLSISFDTTATQKADEIGVKNAVLQEKNWYGGWKDIPMSNYYTNNSSWYSGKLVYTGATKGTTYRVKCTHYAKFGSTELTLNNTSSEIVYN